MNKNIPSLLLRLLALIFWYLSFIFVATLVTLDDPSSIFQNTMRGSDYRWDYEAMFTAIYFVWGIFLWKAARNPEKHLSFIDFTIGANIVHAIVMTIVGFFREGEIYHLLTDSLVLLIPTLLLWYFKKSLSNNTTL